MANTFNTNRKTELVALRAAETAGYLTVGSKAYFKDQLIGKRNGQTYEFVIRDAGEAIIGDGAQAIDEVSSLTERKVDMALKDAALAIDTNIIEAVTDVDWDKEIAQPNGQKLINKLVNEAVVNDVGKQAVAFVGEGFRPIAQAAGYLKSVTDEELFGFIDSIASGILTSNGQQFQPVDAPAFYKSGLLGNFQGVEFRSQRFLPEVVISDELAAMTGTASYTTTTVGSTTTATLNLPVSVSVKRGTPFWIDGVYATDTVGDKTSAKFTFIALEDVTGTEVKVRVIDVNGNGTREVCGPNGETLTAIEGDIIVPEAGTYFGMIIRANGAFEFETLDKLDFSNAESSTGTVNGISVHCNRGVDVLGAKSATRWDIVSLAGIVEPRACAYVLIK